MFYKTITMINKLLKSMMVVTALAAYKEASANVTALFNHCDFTTTRTSNARITKLDLLKTATFTSQSSKTDLASFLTFISDTKSALQTQTTNSLEILNKLSSKERAMLYNFNEDKIMKNIDALMNTRFRDVKPVLKSANILSFYEKIYFMEDLKSAMKVCKEMLQSKLMQNLIKEAHKNDALSQVASIDTNAMLNTNAKQAQLQNPLNFDAEHLSLDTFSTANIGVVSTTVADNTLHEERSTPVSPSKPRTKLSALMSQFESKLSTKEESKAAISQPTNALTKENLNQFNSIQMKNQKPIDLESDENSDDALSDISDDDSTDEVFQPNRSLRNHRTMISA